MCGVCEACVWRVFLFFFCFSVVVFFSRSRVDLATTLERSSGVFFFIVFSYILAPFLIQGRPRRCREKPKGGQETPKESTRNPKEAQVRPKGRSREPKGAQRRAKRRPREAQGTRKEPKGAPREAQGRPKERPREAKEGQKRPKEAKAGHH